MHAHWKCRQIFRGDFEYLGRKNPYGPFHFTSDWNIRNLWYNGKHPRSLCNVAGEGDGKFSCFKFNYFYQLRRYVRADIIVILLLNYNADFGCCRRGKRLLICKLARGCDVFSAVNCIVFNGRSFARVNEEIVGIQSIVQLQLNWCVNMATNQLRLSILFPKYWITQSKRSSSFSRSIINRESFKKDNGLFSRETKQWTTGRQKTNKQTPVSLAGLLDEKSVWRQFLSRSRYMANFSYDIAHFDEL